MDLGPYLASLQQALATTARTAGADVQDAADRLAQSLEPALRLTLMELAADVASEVTVQLDGDVVEVRLRGGAPEVVVQQSPRQHTPPAPPPPPTTPTPPAPEEDGGTARISLRLPDALKTRIEEAANNIGFSVNGWLVRALNDAVAHINYDLGNHPPGARDHRQNIRPGRNISGWVR